MTLFIQPVHNWSNNKYCVVWMSITVIKTFNNFFETKPFIQTLLRDKRQVFAKEDSSAHACFYPENNSKGRWGGYGNKLRLGPHILGQAQGIFRTHGQSQRCSSLTPKEKTFFFSLPRESCLICE